MKKILVIDDNELILESIRIVLEDGKYEVITATNGFEGLEAATEDVSLIILDLSMPVMSGYEFYEKLRAQEDLNHVPVVILTAQMKPEPIDGVEIVAKPINVNDLLSIVAIYTDQNDEVSA